MNIEESESTSTTDIHIYAKDNQIISYLMDYTKITIDQRFTVSSTAIQYFRQNSNVEEVLKEYLVKLGKAHEDTAKYIQSIIRQYINKGLRPFNYPQNKIKFNSFENELYARFLVMNPSVNQQNMKHVLVYLKKFNIQPLAIPMSIANVLYEPECEYIEYALKKYDGYEDLAKRKYRIGHYALQKFYEDNDKIEELNLDDMTVKDMCEISSFEKAVRKLMLTSPDKCYENVAEQTLEAMKINRSLIVEGLDSFVIKPKYRIISNNITPEQEIIIKSSKVNFYTYTNARSIVLQNRMKMSKAISSSLSYEKNKIARERNFFFNYLRSQDRKRPPYHNLCWINDLEHSFDNTNESL